MSDPGRDVPRLEELLVRLERLVGGAYAERLPLSGERDTVDAIAHAVNVLSGELLFSYLATEEASRTKSRLLANLSHELRTPLASILATADLMAREETDAAVTRQRIERIRHNGRHLVGLVDDLLDLGRLESGNIQLELQPADPAAITSTVVDALSEQARAKGLRIEHTIDPRVPDSIETDPLRLRQVLLNVVGNAVKYTAAGSVAVRVAAGAGGRFETLTVEVEDTGFGVELEDRERIFQPFTRGTAGPAGLISGSGIGLALARRLSRQLGGDVELVRTEPGQGSLFRVTVSARVPPARSPPEPIARTTLEGLRLLLADDEVDLRDAYAGVLTLAGALVVTAPDGPTALAEGSRGGFDAVLLDLWMPGLSGLEVARQLRGAGRQLPLIAITAFASAEDKGRCAAAGFDRVLVKPFNAAVLLSTVRDLTLARAS